MSEWLQYVEAFGLKDFPMDEGYSGLDMKFQRDQDGGIESFGKFPNSYTFERLQNSIYYRNLLSL